MDCSSPHMLIVKFIAFLITTDNSVNRRVEHLTRCFFREARENGVRNGSFQLHPASSAPLHLDREMEERDLAADSDWQRRSTDVGVDQISGLRVEWPSFE